MTVLTAHEIVRYLEERGVTRVLGLCGRTITAMLEALSGSEQVEFVNAHHEQIAPHVADGYAEVTHRASVMLTHLGPGLTSAATRMTNAALDSISVVVIAGDVLTHYLGKHPHQEVNHHADVDQWQIYRPFVKWALQIERAKLPPEILDRAFVTAESGRPGPILVDVPIDLFSLPIEATLVDRALVNHIDYVPPTLDVATAERIVTSLTATEYPLVYVGGGVLSTCTSEELTTLMDLLDLSVAHSLMNKGAVSGDNPYVLGMPGFRGILFTNRMCRGVSWVPGLGTRFAGADPSSWHKGFTSRMPSAKPVQIDIDPEQVGRNYPTKIEAVTDLKPAPTTLLEAARKLYPRGVVRKDVTGTILAERVTRKGALVANQTSGELPMNPTRILKDLHDHIPADSFTITDVGWNKNGLAQQYDVSMPGTFITPGGFMTMGFDSPAVLGVQLVTPGRRVIALVDGGGFGQSPAVLTTARRRWVSMMWVVMNSNTYETIAGLEKANYGATLGAVLESEDDGMWLDYSVIAAVYEIRTRKVTSPEDFGVALDEVPALGEPYPIDVSIRGIPTLTSGHWNILGIYSLDGVKDHVST